MARNVSSVTTADLGFEAGTEPPGKPVTMPQRGTPAVPTVQPATDLAASNPLAPDVEQTIHSTEHSSMVGRAVSRLRGDAVVPTSEPELSLAEPAQWRTQIQTVLDVGEYAEGLHQELLEGVEKTRLWAQLQNRDGTVFESFAEFCECPRPEGLGSPEGEVIRVLEAVLGKRAAEGVTYTRSRQGRRTDLAAELPAPSAGSDAAQLPAGAPQPSPAVGKGNRTRAKERRIFEHATEAVRKLYQSGGVGKNEAALLGKRASGPEQQAKVDKLSAMAAETMKIWDGMSAQDRAGSCAEINRLVRVMLTLPPGPAAFAKKFLVKFATYSPEDQETIARAIIPSLPTLGPRPTEPTTPPAPPMSEPKAETDPMSTAEPAATSRPSAEPETAPVSPFEETNVDHLLGGRIPGAHRLLALYPEIPRQIHARMLTEFDAHALGTGGGKRINICDFDEQKDFAGRIRYAIAYVRDYGSEDDPKRADIGAPLGRSKRLTQTDVKAAEELVKEVALKIGDEHPFGRTTTLVEEMIQEAMTTANQEDAATGS